jgi:hypothetical protein
MENDHEIRAFLGLPPIRGEKDVPILTIDGSRHTIPTALVLRTEKLWARIVEWGTTR